MVFPIVNQLSCVDPEDFPGPTTTSTQNCCASIVVDTYQEVRDLDVTQFAFAIALGYDSPDGIASRAFRWNATALSPDDDDSTVLESSRTNVGRWFHTPIG